MEDPGITTMSPPKTYGKNEGVGHLEIKNQVIYHRKPLKICRLWGPMAFFRLSSCHLERCPRKRICACGLLGASTSRGEGAMWYLGSDDGREGWCISLLHEELFATPRYSVFTGRISKIVLFNMPDLSLFLFNGAWLFWLAPKPKQPCLGEWFASTLTKVYKNKTGLCFFDENSWAV